MERKKTTHNRSEWECEIVSTSFFVYSNSSNMYITNWDEFQTAVEELYTASPELVKAKLILQTRCCREG